MLLDEWISIKGEWKRSKLYERMSATKSVRQHGSRVWLTKGQIERKYNDPAVAEAITASKLADEKTKETLTKPHPDAPENEAVSFNCNCVFFFNGFDMV